MSLCVQEGWCSGGQKGDAGYPFRIKFLDEKGKIGNEKECTEYSRFRDKDVCSTHKRYGKYVGFGTKRK